MRELSRLRGKAGRSAQQALGALKPVWSQSPMAGVSSAEIFFHRASSLAPRVSEWPGSRTSAPSIVTVLAAISCSSRAAKTGIGQRFSRDSSARYGLQSEPLHCRAVWFGRDLHEGACRQGGG